MTREEFAEIFPEEPPPWTVIVWRNVDDTHDKHMGDRIFSLNRKADNKWVFGATSVEWDFVPDHFCQPHLELIDYFFSE